MNTSTCVTHHHLRSKTELTKRSHPPFMPKYTDVHGQGYIRSGDFLKAEGNTGEHQSIPITQILISFSHWKVMV